MSASLTGEPPCLLQLFGEASTCSDRERAGLAHRGFDSERLAAMRTQVPATVSPSSRTVGAFVP